MARKHSHQTAPANSVRRDARVDRIGFVKEVAAQYIEGADGLKARVKAGMKPGERVEGDYFFGRLDASTSTSISAAGVVKLYDAGQLTRPQLVSLIGSINAEQARRLIDPQTLEKLTTRRAGTPRLVVDRLPGVQGELVDWIKRLSDAITAGRGEEPRVAA
ncbi:hypothetical protein [Fontivita pretiosa]|uniref:hypothetical protein n=1 Tax=Fontivita pretiosa TaxID=2989684 RepID=UPI003D17DBC5